MAASRKRQALAQHRESSDSDDSSASDQEEFESEEVVQVDFEAYPPDDGDFHGIKSLLQQLFLKAHVDVSEMTNLLIQQNYITSVLKQGNPDEMQDLDDEDEDFNFGVFSVINLTEKKDMECTKQIRSFLLDHCRCSSDSSTCASLESLLNGTKHVGLIISERLTNIPPKIAVPLYESLSQDMEKAKLEKKPFHFEHYILISKLVAFEENDLVIFANAEEELIAEEAVLSFDFSVSNEQDSGLGGNWKSDDAEGQPRRRVLVLPAKKWDTVLSKLTAELGAM